jgi:hypothetical protein
VTGDAGDVASEGPRADVPQAPEGGADGAVGVADGDFGGADGVVGVADGDFGGADGAVGGADGVVGGADGAVGDPDGAAPDAPAGVACLASTDCAPADWCNPATNTCQARVLTLPRSFVKDVIPFFDNQGCLGCHSPGGAGTLVGPVPLLMSGTSWETYKALVAGGTTCSSGASQRVCVDEPRRGLLALRLYTMPGAVSQHSNVVTLFNEWSAPALQMLLQWMAEGAPFDGPVTTSDGGASGAADGSAAGDSGADGQPACDRAGAPETTPCVVERGLGIFVSPQGHDDTGTGTRAAPFATLTKALAAAKAAGRPVFACAGDYPEVLDVGAALDGTRLYGGLACADWRYTADKIRLHPAAAGPALRVHDLAAGFELRDADVQSADGKRPGESSVGALVSASMNVRFVRVALTAGKGALGAAGVAGAKGQGTGKGMGDDASDAQENYCSGGGYFLGTGKGGHQLCKNGATSSGGDGGSATAISMPGGNGTPGNAGVSPAAPGGCGFCSGADSSAVPCVNTGSRYCADGVSGASGGPGTPGLGATGTGMLGTSGWSGLRGADGAFGQVGQGGGGGGVWSDFACYPNVDAVPGSGGGAGSCGGDGGGGGGPGGSSIALISIGSGVELVGCQLTSSDGGAGGLGGDGGASGDQFWGGSAGASASRKACDLVGCVGGRGGTGGKGGPGGGGAGGHSLGLAFVGTSPTLTNSTTHVGAAGAPGDCGQYPAGTSASPEPSLNLCKGRPGRAAATFSSWVDHVTDNQGPSASKNLKTSSSACNRIDVSWDAADDMPGVGGSAATDLVYQLCWSTAAADCADGAGFQIKATTGKNVLAWPITGVAYDTSYVVAVRAVDLSGNTGTVASLMQKVSTTSPLAPSQPLANAMIVSRLAPTWQLSWGYAADSCTPSDHFTYEYCVGGASCATWQALPAGAGMTTISVPDACGATVGVRARNSTQAGAVSIVGPLKCYEDVQGIFKGTGCQVSGCHNAGTNNMLNAATAATWRGGRSACEQQPFAAPGDPGGSYLYLLAIAPVHVPPLVNNSCGVTTMKPGDAGATAGLISRWISDGAQ